MTRLLIALFVWVFSLTLHAEDVEDNAGQSSSEEAWYEDIDWDPFNMKGITPRYAYLDYDNFIGYGHYVGLSYFKKSGAESEGVTFRTGLGTMGKKYNLAYSNSFSFMHVDFGLSYYDLDSDNYRPLNYEELLGIELGLRMWVVQIIGVHTENTSFITLAYGF
ncbi:MAG: hypothetical protein C9356_13610 [Oleiphilus sp.]|mgnify:CR=1 FL=1|nr:MAG: hypothetical protein C9356_13610 [Oleiphilus sp.]